MKTHEKYLLIYLLVVIYLFYTMVYNSKYEPVDPEIFMNKKILPLYILFIPWLLTFPIYYMAADWGRYLYISYMSSLIIVFFFIKNNIFLIEESFNKSKDNLLIKILFILIIIFYSFGWTVPICCEKKFKPGIFKAFDRIVYYYNRQKY